MDKMENPMERRKSTRVRIVIRLKHGKFQSGSLVGETLDAETKDLSIGGLSFASSLPYNLNDDIYLQIDLPGWPKTEIVIGKVVRNQQVEGGMYVIGVQFVTIDKTFQETLGEYVY
jgi:c-di-GMP-binding flagellar brake protein YcgR